MKKFTFILTVLIALTIKVNAQTTITSTTTGGNWSESTTWIGGIVPTISDNVIINSTVYADGNVSCNNLTVNSGYTLYNKLGFSITVSVADSVTNNGFILNNPNGNVLSLNIHGDIENNGVWRINSTTLSGLSDQMIKEASGMKFEGTISMTDSLGDVVLGSDVLVSGNPWILYGSSGSTGYANGNTTWNLNRSKIKTNGHRLLTNSYILKNGYIESNDTLLLDQTVIIDLNFSGNYVLDGNVFTQCENNAIGNVFNGTLTVLDTLTSIYGQFGSYYPGNIQVNGNLVNKGSIIANWDFPGASTGFSLEFRINGNLTNYYVFDESRIDLIGNNPRTITGITETGHLFVYDSIHFAGDNILPDLKWVGSASFCVVDSNATLTLQNFAVQFQPNKILNFGRVYLTQNIDSTISAGYPFYQSYVVNKVGVSTNKLTIDHYGYQQHPNVTGTVNCWWRLRNYPQNFNDSLKWLVLNYKTDALNGNTEDSLKVFFSPNAGLSWNKITTGVSIDTAANTVTIANAPSYGHYLLSSTPLGITTFHPMIETLEPNSGGNTGYVTLYIFGAGFKNTSIVKLKTIGQADIVADTSYLTDAVGESMLAKFNLKNKNIGIYDVVIETPGFSTLTKPDYFTINQGERSDPWVSLTGRGFLLNRWQTYNLNYGNTANTDANGTVLVYAVSDLPGLEVKFPDINFVLPKVVVDMGTNYTRIADSVAIYYVTDSLTGYIGQNMRVYPFYIPTISAFSSSDIRVKFKLPGYGMLKMSAWLIDPLFENIVLNSKTNDPMPSEVKNCINDAAIKAFSNAAIGLIPGMSCYSLVDNVYQSVEYINSPSQEEKPFTFGSFLWSTASWAASTLQCATTFVPGLGQAVDLGVGITSMIIDVKNGADANAECWRKFKKKSNSIKVGEPVSSLDPNEMVGPQGFTADNYISNKVNMSYSIYFENIDTASASALEVFIKDTLDITKFDFSTFSFNTITIGDTTVKIQNNAKEFTILVDMYPKIDIIAQVHGVLDTLTGVISWDFHSLDRITLELTEDPDLGFLPPNVNYPEGVGNVAYSCKLKKTVAHDDIITNKANIVFDFNAPVNTNTFSNKIDTIAPVSSVNILNPIQSDSSFTVSWSGSDQGCGVFNYNIFVSVNDSDYVLWQASAANNTSAVFNGHNGRNYKFYCIATDSIGLTEAQKLTPDAVITITNAIKDVNKPAPQVQFYPNPAADFVTLNIINANNEDIEFNIYNSMGVLVKSEMLKQSFQQINIRDLSNGIYTVSIKSENLSDIRKLIINR